MNINSTCSTASLLVFSSFVAIFSNRCVSNKNSNIERVFTAAISFLVTYAIGYYIKNKNGNNSVPKKRLQVHSFSESSLPSKQGFVDKFDEVYSSRLQQSNTSKTRSEELKKVSEGICVGEVAEFFHQILKNPTSSFVELAKNISIKSAIKYQLEYLSEYERISRTTLTIVGETSWQPSKANMQAYQKCIPWNENCFVFSSDIVGNEKLWKAEFSNLLKSSTVIGRVSFIVNKKSGHVFPFWGKDGNFGYFDNRVIYSSLDAFGLSVAIHNCIILARSNSTRKNSINRDFPVAIFIKAG